MYTVWFVPKISKTKFFNQSKEDGMFPFLILRVFMYEVEKKTIEDVKNEKYLKVEKLSTSFYYFSHQHYSTRHYRYSTFLFKYWTSRI